VSGLNVVCGIEVLKFHKFSTTTSTALLPGSGGKICCEIVDNRCT